MLFNEPKLLKLLPAVYGDAGIVGFSALQRAEIAEIGGLVHAPARGRRRFSALQRAEIAEIERAAARSTVRRSFSALQRAEIAEISVSRWLCVRSLPVSVLFNEPKLLKSSRPRRWATVCPVSVLFNEPKLLKSARPRPGRRAGVCFSALQRAEIAEMALERARESAALAFQCSSTSRNC